MLRRLRQMLVKEFLQVFRDKRTRFVLIAPPIIQMMVFGYAATLEVRHVPTAILDLDHSRQSRDFIARFSSSRYFNVREYVDSRRALDETIGRGNAVLGIQIRAGFARKLLAGQTAPVQVIVDGTNSNTALVALGYVNRIADRYSRDDLEARLQRASPALARGLPSVEVESRPWFNTNLQSRWFFVPGVIGSLILVMIVLLTAFAVVREREIGTLEQIMVTPIRRTEFILGKTVPFFLIGLADAAMIAAVGTLWFDVPFRGSIAVLFLGTALFLLCTLGVGLLISTVSANQQQAMVAAFFFDMPAIIFSGFGFPISSMPESLQPISYFDPLRYFVVILRSTYLKGVGLDVLWPQMAAMAAIATVTLAVSVLRFQKSLE
jgi:ABC-2 type transport system permease protein